MCNIIVFTDCESCTRPISINPGSVEAGKYGLTRGACSVERRLEVVAVADFGVCYACGEIFSRLFFRDYVFVFFLRTHTACRKYEAALPHVPLY